MYNMIIHLFAHIWKFQKAQKAFGKRIFIFVLFLVNAEHFLENTRYQINNPEKLFYPGTDFN